MLRMTVLPLLLLGWISSTLAREVITNSTNFFYTPVPAGQDASGQSIVPIWTVGENYEVAWTTTSLVAFKVRLWQQNLTADSANEIAIIYDSQQPRTGFTNYTWECTKGIANLNLSTNFYFEWHDNNDLVIFSPRFNMTEASSTATTTSTTAASSSSSTSSTTSATSSIASTPAVTSDSTATKVGLGVGLGIGIPLVLIFAVWVGFSIMRKRRDSRNASVPPKPYWQDENVMYPSSTQELAAAATASRYEKSAEPYRSELASRQDAVELPSEQKRA